MGYSFVELRLYKVSEAWWLMLPLELVKMVITSGQLVHIQLLMLYLEMMKMVIYTSGQLVHIQLLVRHISW